MQTAQHHPARSARTNRSFGVLTPEAQAHRRRCMSLPPVRPGEAPTSHGGFSGHQRRHRLPDALRGTGRAAAAVRAKRILTMRAYLTATGMALGLLVGWAALVPFVA
jgi:hypothetical protein